MNFEKVTITDEALKEIKLITERQKIRKPAVYLDIVKTCCSSMPKVDVVDRTLRKIEIVGNANGVPVCVSDLLKNLLNGNEELNSVELKVDLVPSYGLFFQFSKTSNSEDT